MSDNPMFNKVQGLRGLIGTGLDRIAKLNKLVPALKRTDENLMYIENSLRRSPPGLYTVVDEELIDYLDIAETDLSVLRDIPAPEVYLESVVNTSGSAVLSGFRSYVTGVRTHFVDNREIVSWATETLADGEKLEAIQSRSERANRRLTQLNKEIGQLHRQAIDATLAAQANAQTPIEAAQMQDRVLEQFKGILIAKCKSGKGTNYDRISDNLAANSTLTKQVVLNGQKTFNDLHNELVAIRKRIKPSTGERMGEILRLLEDHIIVITGALDPEKAGVVFED